MRNRKRRGSTIVEFVLVATFFLVPMLVFTYAIGFNLLEQLEVVQFCRDSGHMYVTLHEVSQVSLADANFQAILAKVGANAGYPTNAQVIFSRIMYVDDATCILAGLTAGCTNSGYWAYSQYYVTPSALPSSISGFTPTFQAPSYTTADTQKQYTLAQTAGQTGLRVSPNVTSTLGIIPYALNPTLGLPSGQAIYCVEVGSAAFNLPGLVSFTALRDFAVF